MKTAYTCAHCGKKFEEWASQMKRSPQNVFCSRDCYRKHGRKSVKCETCGKDFIVKKATTTKFCSKECKEKSLIRNNRKCKTCGKPIEQYVKKYCSSACRLASRRVEKICTICGKKFPYLKSKQGTSWVGKFCSWDCFKLGHPRRQEKVEKNCEICGKHFEVAQRHKKQRFCSSECFGRHLYNQLKENPALVEKMIKGSRISKKGKYISVTNGRQFSYHSSYELIRMMFLDKYGLKWEKNIDLAIPYIDVKGKERLYIPDFLVEEGGIKYLEESKGFERENDSAKFKAGEKYATEHGMVYHVLRTKIENKKRPSEIAEVA